MHEALEWASLIAWVLTAGGGLFLVSLWLRSGGLDQREGRDRIRPPLVFSHFGLAATGLVLWIVYLVTDSGALAWIAFALLAVVAVLGWTMFAIWYQRRQRRPHEAGDGDVVPDVPAEQHFPVPAVTLHGILAVTTVVLVFLTALGLGE